MSTLSTQIAQIFAEGNQADTFSYDIHDSISDGYWEGWGSLEDDQKAEYGNESANGRPPKDYILEWVESDIDAQPEKYIDCLFEFSSERGDEAWNEAVAILKTSGEEFEKGYVYHGKEYAI